MTATVASPVSGHNLLIQRAGRVLLQVASIELGGSGCTVIVGPNGAGKSLLVKTLCDLQLPDTGSVSWAGTVPDRSRRHRVGLLLQRPVLLQRTAQANLVYALRQSGLEKRLCVRAADEALELASLGAVAKVQASQLSGGEQQRLALARALLLAPDILFLDEATANVDPSSTLVIEQQLKLAIAQGLSVVMVSHDIGQVRRMADEVVLMAAGRVVEQCSSTYFFEKSANLSTRRWIAGELLV